MAQNLPDVDEKRIRDVFSRLGNMEVELDPDPLVYGPKRLNGKVAQARGLLTECERIFLQVSHDLQLYKRAFRGSQLDFDLRMQDLLANDIDVRAGRNVRDRDAIATMKLHEERRELMDLEVSIQDLEMVMSVVKAKRADLRDIQSRLRDQMKLCQEEIGLGNKWGSKPPEGQETPNLDTAPKTDQKALASMQALLVEDAGEVHLAPGDEDWMEDEDSEEDGDTDEGDEIDDEDVDAILKAAEIDDYEPEPGTVEEPGEVTLTFGSDGPQTMVVGSTGPAEELNLTPSGTLSLDTDDMSIDDLIDATSGDDLGLAPPPDPRGKPPPPSEWKPLIEYPFLGYCDVCGEPAYESPGGSLCVNGHGGAPVSPERPKAEPEAEEETPAEVVDLFDQESEPEQDEVLPAVATTKDVDDFFDQLSVEPAKTRGKKGISQEAAEDLDDILSLFGA